jgi:hypothetical protein
LRVDSIFESLSTTTMFARSLISEFILVEKNYCGSILCCKTHWKKIRIAVFEPELSSLRMVGSVYWVFFSKVQFTGCKARYSNIQISRVNGL